MKFDKASMVVTMEYCKTRKQNPELYQCVSYNLLGTTTIKIYVPPKSESLYHKYKSTKFYMN